MFYYLIKSNFLGDTMKDWEDIKINKRRSDKIRFESPLIQSISDSIDFLREESKEILKELDSSEIKQHIDDIDIEKFGEETIDQISDIVDDMSQFKDEIVNSNEVPDVVKESSRDIKFALNRDEDYVRRAKRKLARANSNDEEVNNRIIELSNKAIEVNYRNWEAYYLKGVALYNLDKFEEAIEQFIKSLALNENNINARLYVANSYRLSGKFSQAIDAYDSVLRINENSFDAFKGKALTYYNCQDYVNADEFFKKANFLKTLDDNSKEIWDICLEKI